MPSRRSIQRRGASAKLVVRALNAAAQRGYLNFGPFRVPCALGRGGVKVLKREGDGATPRGRFPLRAVYYKSRVGMTPGTILQRRALRRNAGWCDSPSDRNYNRPVTLPYQQSAEHLWREDGIYDVIVVLGYNDVPRSKNRGSAIFMHLARSGFPPTEGCVALRPADLKRLLRVVPRRAEIVIEI
jgi:L,D-peptidoglycan transpeptidase YkuD (ErfK/YbiS/YcfS/YnhG family)